MASRVHAPPPTLRDGRPPTSASVTVPSPTLTEATVANQRWRSLSLSRSRTASETVVDFDPEKDSFRRRESTRTLDQIEYALHGYPRLATFMGHEPGAAIYRRFASLNSRILLYRQAEIVRLEHELDDLEKSLQDRKHLHYSIKELMHASPGTEGARLWDKVQQLDTALERYNALLLQQKALYDLPSADDIDTNDLYNFIHNAEMGGRWLQHPEDTIWETIPEKRGKYRAEQRDLVRLSGDDRYKDPFSRFIWGPALQFFHQGWSRIRRPNLPAGGYTYNEKVINRISKTFGMATASLLPTISVLVLYLINDNMWRLIFIVIFSAVFTAALAAFTSASRAEVFIASVSLAGVQAVFVSNFLGNSGSSGNGEGSSNSTQPGG